MSGGTRHDKDLLAALFLGETRQVWALEPDGRRFYLPEGGADEAVKARASAGELTCPVPGCEFPAFQARGGTRRRHHFGHVTKPAGGHDGESIFHLQAKFALMAWARAEHPDARVEDEVAFPGRERVADVLVTFPGGERVAFEVQYSRLAVEGHLGWAARHAWYAANGITDVWVFAPRPPHLTQSPRPVDLPDGEPNRKAWLGPLQEHLAAEDHPILWFNPETRKIATPIVQGPPVDEVPEGTKWWLPDLLADVGPRRPRRGDRLVDLFVDALDGCRLTPAGVITPTDEWLAGERDRLTEQAKAAAEEAARREEERRRAAAAHRPAPTKEAAAPAQPRRPVASRWGDEPGDTAPRAVINLKLWHARPLPAWDEHNSDFQWLQRRHGNQTPAPLTEPHPADHGIDAPVIQWRTAIYRHLAILGHPPCCEGDAIEALFQLAPAHTAPLLHQTATAFYRTLIASGLLT